MKLARPVQVSGILATHATHGLVECSMQMFAGKLRLAWACSFSDWNPCMVWRDICFPALTSGRDAVHGRSLHLTERSVSSSCHFFSPVHYPTCSAFQLLSPDCCPGLFALRPSASGTLPWEHAALHAGSAPSQPHCCSCHHCSGQHSW